MLIVLHAGPNLQLWGPQSNQNVETAIINKEFYFSYDNYS